jgi:Kelch motif
MGKHSKLAAGAARRRVVLAVGLGVAVAVAAGAGVSAQAGTGSGARPARAASSRPASHRGAVLTAVQRRAGTWKLLPAAPVTMFPQSTVTVWTGHEMIIHGSLKNGRGVTFAYRPARSKWAKLRPGPKPLSAEAVDIAVWTGSRMLVMGLTNGSYNPAANTWRQIAPLPHPDEGAVVGWTGHQAIVWGGVCCDGLSHDGAAYNPATNTWRMLPTAPLKQRRNAMGGWTGKLLVVAGGFTRPRRFFRDAAAYNPATRKWRKLAPMPAARGEGTALWDGKEMLFIGGARPRTNLPVAHGLAYNPATNHWRWLPAMKFPRTGFAAVWTGRQVLVWGGLTGSLGHPGIPPHGEAYNPVTNRWTALHAAPLHGRAYPAAAWTGRQMIVWGGYTLGDGTPPKEFTDGAAYTP